MRLVTEWSPLRAWRVLVVASALIGLGAGLLDGPHATEQPAKSVWDGVYTDTQAKRGKAVFLQNCNACHSSGDQAPALYGSDFLSDFDGMTLGDLFDRIKNTMPQDRPASLSPQDAADAMAYVLSFSFPVGQTELDHESAPLKQIRFEAAKPKP
jgi:mono/diheme cytochrome c family protein